MVSTMRPGSVIVDLASEQGGNCELTQPGEVASVKGVSIVGYTDMASRMATQSSQLYSTNIRHLLTDLTPQKDGEARIDMNDDVMRGATVVHEGAVSWPPPPPKQAAIAAHKPPAAKPAVTPANGGGEAQSAGRSRFTSLVVLAVAVLALLALGAVAPAAFVEHLSVFVLAIFVGYQVVWNVTPALHTPLMSVTNAISGIIVIGALLQLGTPNGLVTILGGVALLVATINIAGGFLVTHRMLKMFQRN
jgi:NAD(P) transhydrogenase subunit alpha